MPLEALATRASAGGFDLGASFATADWNATASPEHRLADFGRPRALAVVVANTQALWPRFLAWLADEPTRRHAPDPLDDYTERTLMSAAAATGLRADLTFAHRAPFAPIQRMADLAGLAHLQPSHLSVHPVYGPWIAMRAVIVLDADGPPAPTPRTAPACDCAHGCGPHFERAAGLGFDPGHEPTWRAWVAIRDACPIGRAHRYADEQIRYHYGKDRTVLGPARTPSTRPPGSSGSGNGSDPPA